MTSLVPMEGQHIEGFLRSLQRRALSKATVSSYQGRLKRLAGFLGERGSSLAEASREDVEAFFDSLVLAGLSPRSRHGYFYCARAFYRWLGEIGAATLNPMEFLRPPKVTERMWRCAWKEQVEECGVEGMY